MPIYEYHCEPCNGLFELLRPARDAAKEQPCPECDQQAKRIVSREFAAFTFRDGWPRRLPDDGSYLHFEKKVSSPISGASFLGVTHPELSPPQSYLEAASLEEIERWEDRLGTRRDAEAEVDGHVIDADFEREKAAFAERVTAVPGSKTVERAKRRLIKKDLEDVGRVQAARERRAR